MHQLEFFLYGQKSFKYAEEALTPLLRLGTLSWIVTRDSHKKFLNSQPWSRPTRQRSAAHRLRTAGLRPSPGNRKITNPTRAYGIRFCRLLNPVADPEEKIRPWTHPIWL